MSLITGRNEKRLGAVTHICHPSMWEVDQKFRVSLDRLARLSLACAIQDPVCVHKGGVTDIPLLKYRFPIAFLLSECFRVIESQFHVDIWCCI